MFKPAVSSLLVLSAASQPVCLVCPCTAIRSVDQRLVGLEHPHFLAVGLDTEANLAGFARLRVEQRDVGGVDGCFLLEDAALLVEVRVRLRVALHHVDAGHQHAAVVQHAGDLAALALVPAGDNDHFIITLELLHVLLPVLYPGQSTSGASEMMRMNFSVRSLRVTGANARVPIGASWLFTRLAALSSNLISEPSWRRTPLLVRTTSAFSTWPFLTLPRGMASFTVTLMTSPIRA